MQSQEVQLPIIESEKKIDPNLIFSSYLAFERVEMLSFELDFKCENLFDALYEKDGLDFEFLQAIIKNTGSFKKLYRSNILSIEKISEIEVTEFNTLINLSSQSMPNQYSQKSSSLKRHPDSFFSSESNSKKTMLIQLIQ